MFSSRLFKGLLMLALAATLSACATQVATQPRPAANYEVWAMDQGTHIVHIFNSSLQEIASIDLGSQGAKVPHMIEFTADQRYAFIANPSTGNVAVVRAPDRKLVALLSTGPRTHHAAVAPGSRSVLVSVIGAVNVPWDGKLVEMDVDLANERFTLGRTLLLADDPLFASHKSELKDSGGAVCTAFTADGRYAYVTLGPGLDEGGVVVLDTRDFRLVKVYGPGQVQANCGTLLSPDAKHMYLVGGDKEVGVVYASDVRTHQPVHRMETRGHDAHGSALTPDGKEYWLVNRVTSNAVVMDPKTHQILAELPFVGKTPDIVAISPDSRYAFITLRGPKPVTMPHLAVGETPGVAVFDIRGRNLVRLLEPAKGNELSDFHGIAVRRLD
jgi:DNA-binding beta-propeller fold protein YncE